MLKDEGNDNMYVRRIVLAVVKLTSITTGPSANEAMVAIRVAQHDLAQAQRVDRGSEFTSLSNADAALILARQHLAEGRYEEAILAAHQARESVLDVR